MDQLGGEVDALNLIQYLPQICVQLLEFGLQASCVQTAQEMEKFLGASTALRRQHVSLRSYM